MKRMRVAVWIGVTVMVSALMLGIWKRLHEDRVFKRVSTSTEQGFGLYVEDRACHSSDCSFIAHKDGSQNYFLLIVGQPPFLQNAPRVHSQYELRFISDEWEGRLLNTYYSTDRFSQPVRIINDQLICTVGDDGSSSALSFPLALTQKSSG